MVEIAPGEAEQVTGLVRDAMEHAVDLAVPLDVSTGIGSDWQLAATDGDGTAARTTTARKEKEDKP